MSVTKHPTLPFALTKSDGEFRDNEKSDYTRITSLVHRCFLNFSDEAASERVLKQAYAEEVAAKESRLTAVSFGDWYKSHHHIARHVAEVKAYGLAAASGATTPAANSYEAVSAFKAIDSALTMIRKQYDILAAGQIIFDPVYLIAGTVDLVLRNKLTSHIVLAGWRTGESFTVQPTNRDKGQPPLDHVPDSDAEHEALRFALYAKILHGAYYFKQDIAISSAIIYLPELCETPAWINLPDRSANADIILQQQSDKVNA